MSVRGTGSRPGFILFAGHGRAAPAGRATPVRCSASLHSRAAVAASRAWRGGRTVVVGPTSPNHKGAFFFAMAVAVGLTPEMLPMIVSVCLAKGALAMSRKKVIVKRLNAIQNFGGMDVLCTDKTGTLTEDRVVLQRHCNVAGRETDEVLRDGYLISHFQTGLKNLLDTAILNSSDFHEQALIEKYKKLDEFLPDRPAHDVRACRES